MTIHPVLNIPVQCSGPEELVLIGHSQRDETKMLFVTNAYVQKVIFSALILSGKIFYRPLSLLDFIITAILLINIHIFNVEKRQKKKI